MSRRCPEGAPPRPAPPFAVRRPGSGTGDFSFLVIGDTGEGDASQHVAARPAAAGRGQRRTCVRRRLVRRRVSHRRDARLRGASSGCRSRASTKPVYAIPGNHDWYDALEAFAATFLEPDAARAAIRARVEADNRLTSTTDGRIEDLIGEAARLRQRIPGADRSSRRRTSRSRPSTSRCSPWTPAWLAASTRHGDGAGSRRALDPSRGKLRWSCSATRCTPAAGTGRRATPIRADPAAMLRSMRCRGGHGRRHARPQYYESRRATMYRRRQRRRRRVPELRDGARRPAVPARPMGVLPDHGRGRPGRSTNDRLVESAGLVVDDEVRRVAVLGRVAVGRLRLQRRRRSTRASSKSTSISSGRRLRLWPVGVHGRLRWSDLESGGGVRPPGVPAGAFVEWVVAAGT